MKRREFITLVGGAVASPLVAHAQQIRDMRTVGVIMSSAENDAESQTRIAAFFVAAKIRGYRGPDLKRVDYTLTWRGYPL
jgi:hypothetical protein